MSCLIDTEKPGGEVRESITRQADKSGGPQERGIWGSRGDGIWNSQGGGKEKLFFLSTFLSLSHIKRFYL